MNVRVLTDEIVLFWVGAKLSRIRRKEVDRQRCRTILKQEKKARLM